MDGVPFITQDPIKPGGTFNYEFTVRNPGSHMYHSYHNAAEQATKGLLGAFIIEPKDKSSEPKVDKDGWPLPMPYKLDTLTVAPGERWDVTVVCDQPGVWAFHCHFLIHAESAHGMFGMVTAVIVQA